MTESYARSSIQETRDAASERESARARQRCVECGGRLVTDEEHGETVCEECGLIAEENVIDRGPEWRAFDQREAENRSRVGAPTTTTMHDKGLSTNIGWQDKDAYGKSLSPRQRERMQRLRTWDERYRTRDAKERNLKHALGEIDRMASALGLPETVRETAAVIYRQALDDDLLPGRSIEGVATSSIYAAARQAGVPRSIDEIAAVSRVDEMELKRTYRYVVRELALEIQPADPQSYIARFAAELDLSDAAERRAHELLKTAKERTLHSGKSPVGLAAAAIYAGATVIDEPVTQAAVSDASGMSEVTIRNRYRELLDAEEGQQPS